MSARSLKLRVRGRMAPVPEAIALPSVPRRPIGRYEWGVALGFLAAWIAFFAFVVAIRDKVPLDEMVMIIDEPPPPPPPPPAEPPPPKDITPPKPVPPDPDQPPPPPMDEPPPPQFGLDADALTGEGTMAVATGNTLMKPPDEVIKPPAAPLPPAPVQASYDAQVVKEVAPAYPEWALEQGVSLTVKVLISLDTAGKVSEVRFLNAGQRDFNANIKRAIQSSVFKPLVVAGRPVPVRIVKEYAFELE